MQITINDETEYFFTCPYLGRYQTLSIGWIREDLIKALKVDKDKVSRFIYKIEMKVGENLFICHVDKPLYLINCRNKPIFNFAGDHNQLNLYPTNVPENLDIAPIIDFPSYFTKGVEPLIDYMISDEFYVHQGNQWTPVDI